MRALRVARLAFGTSVLTYGACLCTGILMAALQFEAIATICYAISLYAGLAMGVAALGCVVTQFLGFVRHGRRAFS